MLENTIGMVVVGPEEPLVNGIVDFFETDDELKSIPIVGPNRLAAQLKAVRIFRKQLMICHNIPTAGYLSVTSENLNAGIDFLKNLKAPYVLKAIVGR